MARGSIAIHPEAVLEAHAARVWYSARSPAAGRASLEELDRAVDRIGQAPDQWSPYGEGLRRYLLHRFPFSVIYRERDGEIVIIAVAHERRRPGDWKERVG